MLLSEMITAIQDVINEHGDLETNSEIDVEPMEAYSSQTDSCSMVAAKVFID